MRYIKRRFPGNESNLCCKIRKPNRSFRPQHLQSLTSITCILLNPNGKEIIHDLSFQASPGQIIGVTGPVACGKSTLGKTFLCESPYEGSITFGGKELGKMEKADRNRMVGYLGHDPELFHGSVEENIRLGGKEGAEEMIRVVCLEDEVKAMENGIHTLVGTGGVRLSGGQAQRLALARTCTTNGRFWFSTIRFRHSTKRRKHKFF